MSTTYTATPDAVVSGGAVQVTEPQDGDLASAASHNVSVEKLADLVKKLVNQSILAGIDPSVLNANMPNGLLFASEDNGNGSFLRIYSRLDVSADLRGIMFTRNASWDGSVWTRDNDSSDAYAFGISTDDPGFSVADGGSILMLFRDTTASATWADTGWSSNRLTSQSSAAAAGVGIVKTQAGVAPTFQNSWANGALAVLIRKDHFGDVRLSGNMSGGSTGTVAFTLPAAYRPAGEQRFNAAVQAQPGVPAMVKVKANGDVEVEFTAGAIVYLDGITFR